MDLLEQNAQSPKLLNGYSDENATPQYTQKAKPQKRGLLSGETNPATSSRCNRRWMRRGGSEGPTHENSHVSTTPRSNTSIVLPSRIRPGRRRCHTTQTSGGPPPSKQGHKDQAHYKASASHDTTPGGPEILRQTRGSAGNQQEARHPNHTSSRKCRYM